MITALSVRCVVETFAQNNGLFVVDVAVHPANFIEVEVDSLTGVTLDHCAALTRCIEAHFDRDVEDYELQVASPGWGQMLKVPMQYQKLLGQEVEILLKTGEKITAVLRAASETEINVEYQKKQLLEDKKHKKLVTLTPTIPLTETKWVKAVVKV